MNIRPDRSMIVLVGGEMTAEGGDHIDSRQPLEGDRWSEVMNKSLGTSWFWWLTVSSVVMPILESRGQSAFALVIGDKAVVELRGDGSTRRTSLKGLLPGGVGVAKVIRTGMENDTLPADYTEATTLEAWNGQSLGKVGVTLPGDLGLKWRFLDGNPFYLKYALRVIDPAVVVDTTGSLLGRPPFAGIDTTAGDDRDRLATARYQDMETSRLHDNIVLVVPHTAGIEVVMGDYSRWVSAGRPEGRDVVSQLAEGVPMWDPDAPPDPVRYLRLVPVEANFKVTGVIQDARPRNPGDIEAARSLLASRYDLKIGFWDLVSNPLLRQTLLDKMPEKPAPEIQAVVPLIASARASKAVAKRVDERMAEKQALAAVTEEMECIESIGWARSKARSDGFQLASFALTEPMQRWETQPASPLVSLGLTVNRRSCSIAMHTTMYNDVSVPTYMSTRKERFEQIALQSLPRLGQIAPVLWSLSGGWGDSVDWRQRCEKIAVMTPQWVDALADLVTECRAKHTDKRSFWERQSDARP